MSQKHLFAFYYPSITKNSDYILTIFDESLVHRISTVLRMKAGDQCILFNAEYAIRVALKTVDRKSIIVTVLSRTRNTKPSVQLTAVLPLLKKDSLYKAVYGATEMGVSEIHLVITTRSRKSLLPHEFTRLKNTIIAASEQAKHFTMATLQLPRLLKEYVAATPHPASLVADPTGSPIFRALSNLSLSRNLTLFVGPEGDFSQEERDIFDIYGVQSVRLTPTVLQSYHAALLLVGVCSSYLD